MNATRCISIYTCLVGMAFVLCSRSHGTTYPSSNWPESPALCKGDLSPIEDAFRRGDLEVLVRVYMRARRGQYADWSQTITDEGERVRIEQTPSWAINQRVRARAEELLLASPGHGRRIRKDMDDLYRERAELAADTSDPDSQGLAENCAAHARLHFEALVHLASKGSMECIQIVGDILYADVLVKKERPDGKPFTQEEWDERNKLMSKLMYRAKVMHEALGAFCPVKKTGVDLTEDQAWEIQAWWMSDAAKPYREWRYETDEPMAPPRKRAKPLNH